MSTQQTPELSAALEAVSRRRTPRMPPVKLGLRVKTSPPVRGLLPTGLLIARAERRGGALWESSPQDRQRAISAMRAIVAGTSRAGEIEQIAREHLIECEVDRVLFWQPWSAKIDQRSRALLRTALSADRGVLLSACHLAAYYRSMRALPVKRRQYYMVVAPWYVEEPSHDYWGRRQARFRKGTRGRTVLSTGSYRLLAALLERSECIYVYYDMPGRHETDFLGKTAMLADGTARLAIEADAPVLALRARRVGHHVWVDVAPPLDPREHVSADELHDALALVHERWILEEPAAMADPNSFGWDGGAGSEAWIRP